MIMTSLFSPREREKGGVDLLKHANNRFDDIRVPECSAWGVIQGHLAKLTAPVTSQMKHGRWPAFEFHESCVVGTDRRGLERRDVDI